MSALTKSFQNFLQPTHWRNQCSIPLFLGRKDFKINKTFVIHKSIIFCSIMMFLHPKCVKCIFLDMWLKKRNLKILSLKYLKSKNKFSDHFLNGLFQSNKKYNIIDNEGLHRIFISL